MLSRVRKQGFYVGKCLPGIAWKVCSITRGKIYRCQKSVHVCAHVQCVKRYLLLDFYAGAFMEMAIYSQCGLDA